jgi:hypothetical protein
MQTTKRSPFTSGLIRTGLLLAALTVCVWLIAAHGLRGLAVVAALAVLTALPQNRGFRLADRWLIRVTGSRRRALALLMAIAVTAIVGVGLLELLR